MRYVAVLQRFDTAHVDVASGTKPGPVIDAAMRIYSQLIGEILMRGLIAIKNRAIDEKTDAGPESFWRDTQDNLQYDGIATQLSAEEWNVTVYDREAVDPANLIPIPNEVIFTVGATLEGTVIR